MRKSNQDGFTLVEMAIVLMIIGLLIGGILRGQELMENARVTSTIQQVKAYTGAFTAFMDQYSGKPGDHPRATVRLPGCNAASNCGNGDGNGYVGDLIISGGGNEARNQAGTTALPRVETSYFWKHLSLARLISGVDPTSNPSNPVWGSTHPAAKISASGFHVFYSGTIGDWGTGHVLRLQPGVNTAPYHSGTPGGMAISPVRARQIDEKMDDGMSDRGRVASDYDGTNCDPGGRYAVTDQLNCIMYFNIE